MLFFSIFIVSSSLCAVLLFLFLRYNSNRKKEQLEIFNTYQSNNICPYCGSKNTKEIWESEQCLSVRLGSNEWKLIQYENVSTYETVLIWNEYRTMIPIIHSYILCIECQDKSNFSEAFICSERSRPHQYFLNPIAPMDRKEIDRILTKSGYNYQAFTEEEILYTDTPLQKNMTKKEQEFRKITKKELFLGFNLAITSWIALLSGYFWLVDWGIWVR
jgi:ribosomal protein L37AE/L43A